MYKTLHKHYSQQGLSISFEEWNKARLKAIHKAIETGTLSLQDVTPSDRPLEIHSNICLSAN